jgi:hypothetical protein
MLVMVKAKPPVLVTVTVCQGLAAPTNWSAKVRAVVERLTPGLKATSRMRLLLLSAMKRWPRLSTATPAGLPRLALMAGPPSPRLGSHGPPPATVVMMPVAAPTRRMRSLPLSGIKRFPALSREIPEFHMLKLRLALVAGPPSPLKPAVPFPATVVIFPVVLSTRRMR